MRIWGGLQAGPDGSIQVINADGSINGATGIADGSITFAKWASNGCADGNVPIYNLAGLAWECGTASGGGGLATTDNAVITGNWRFSTNTLFGDTTTPQQLIHVYESGAAAGLRLEHGGASWWDFTATGSSLTTGTSSGTVTTLTASGLGILKTPATALDVLGTATVTGLIINGTVASHVIPSAPDTYDLGSSEKLWRQGYLSQMNAILFAEETATLLGGYTIIAKDAGKFAQSVASAATAIDFGQTMTPGQFVLVRAHDTAGTIRAEYLTVGSLTGGTIYNVTRDLAGTSSPDPAWADSTPYMVLGALGDGRIELNAYNTPKISFVTQGSTYGAQTEQLRLGALDGMPGVAAGKFGFYVGDTTSAGMSFFDSTLLVRGGVNATSGWFGNSSAQGVAIDSTGLSVGSTGAIRNGSTTYSSGSGYFLGADAGTQKFRVGSTTDYLRWNGTSIDIAANGSGLTNINGGNITSGTVTATQMAANAITAEKLFVASGGSALNRDPQPSDVTAWDLSTTAMLFTTGDGPVGPKMFVSQVGQYQSALGRDYIPVDKNKTYRLRFWGYRDSGDGTLYGGVNLRNAAGTIIDGTIQGFGGTFWLYDPSAVTPTNGVWVEYSAQFGFGTAYPFPSNASTMAPLVLLNCCAPTTGAYYAQDIRIEEVVPSTLIQDGAITTNKITADAIIGQHIAAGTITAADIFANTLTATEIAANAITTSELDANSVTSAKIVAGTIEASDIAAGTITADRITSGTLTATQIQSASITADRLSVSSLSAISANLGTVTAGSISGVTITAGSGNEVVLNSTGIELLAGTGTNNKIKWDNTAAIYGHTGTPNSFLVMSADNLSLNGVPYFGNYGGPSNGPAVIDSSGILSPLTSYMTNGIHCGAGVSRITTSFGIVTSVLCSDPAELQELRQELQELRNLLVDRSGRVR